MPKLELKPLGGIDGRHFPPMNTAERVVNMRTDRMGAWQQAGGYRGLLDEAHEGNNYFDDQGTGTVYSIHWFAQHNGARQWTVFELDNGSGSVSLVHMAGPSEAFVTIDDQDQRTFPGTSAGTQYLEVNNWLWYFNGFDEPRRWNGEVGTRIGFDRAPPAPVVSGPSDGGTVGFNVRDYSWYFDPPAYHTSTTTPLTHPGYWGNYTANWAQTENNAAARGLGLRADDHDGSAQSTVEPWRYNYRWTWVNDLGQESPASEAATVFGVNYGLANQSATADTGGGRRGALVQMPDAPSWVRGYKLYRTRNLAGLSLQDDAHVKYYLHSVYTSAKGTQLIDVLPDEELEGQLDEASLGAVPRGFKYAAVFKGTVFVSGTAENPGRVHFSKPGFPEQFPELNYFDIGNRASGEATGLYATKNALVVFKARGIYLIRSDGQGGFSADTLTEDTGCLSANALAEVPGKGLLFLGQDGPYLLEGALTNADPTRVIYLGARIQRIWSDEVNVNALMRACAVTFRPDNEVWIQVPAYGDDRPKLGLVWHYDIDAWSVREDYPISCMTVSDDHRQYLMFGSWDSADNGVWVYRPDIPDQNGTAIEAEWRSNWVGGRSYWGRATVRYVEAYVWGLGTRDLTCEMQMDRRHGWGLDLPYTLEQRDSEQARPKWGTDAWSSSETGTYTEYDPTIVKFNAMHETTVDGQLRRLAAHGYEFQFSLIADKVKLLGVALTYDRGPDEGFEKLDQDLAPEVR